MPFATEPMAEALARAGPVLPHRRDGDREAYDIAWVEDKTSPVDTINGFIEVYMDARGIKGAWEALVFYVNREKTERHPEAGRRTRSGSRTACRGIRKYRKPDVHGHHRQRHRRRRRDRRLGTDDADRHQPAERSGDPRAVRQQVGLARQRQRGLRQVARCRSSAASSRGRRRKSARAERWGAFAGELTTEHARSDRPRVGPGGRAAERHTRRPRSRSSTRRSRRRAPIWSRCISCADPKLVEIGLVPAPSSDGDRARRVRGLRAQRAGAAAAGPRGHADRRRPHAQPPDDRPLADGQHQGDRGAARATARPIYVMIDPQGVPRRRRPAARRSAAHQVRRRLRRGAGRCSRPTACTSTRSCATRSSRASTQLKLPSYTGFVMPKLEAA